MSVRFPYGTGELTLNAPVDEVLSARPFPSRGADEDEIVREAMARPIGSERLSELARGRRDVTVIVSDHTRPVPSQKILPHMLAALRSGNPDIRVTLLVATGCHRGTTRDELRKKLGGDILARERIEIHDCRDEKNMVDLGALPSGARLLVNRFAAEAELLASEGFIEPHFFAGYSGGRKSVLPGVCARETVLGNHCAAFIDDPRARTGVLDGNPIHRDMLAAARMAKLAYVVNVVIDDSRRVLAAFAGDARRAHEAGCRALDEYARVSPRALSDIVITSNGGSPLDQNAYQAVKGLTAAEAAAAPGAVLIQCAECLDGTGGEGFFRALSECESPAALLRETRATPQSATKPDQWEAQILARILDKHHVIFVSRPEMADTLRKMKLDWAASPDEAMRMARAIVGEGARATAIPNGISVVVRPNA